MNPSSLALSCASSRPSVVLVTLSPVADDQRFETHARTVTLLTMLSRVTGLARDAAFSRVFGAGPLMSAFFFAFMIPNLFRRLFGEGALSAAFLPVYAKLLERDPAAARALAMRTLSWLVIALGLVTIVCEGVLFLFAGEGEQATAVRLMMIMLPYMPLVCLVAFLGAMLQVHGRFGPTAAAPIVLNACIIAATLGLLNVFNQDDPRGRLLHASIIGASVVGAGVIQVAWSAWALRNVRERVDRRAAAAPVGDEFRRMLRLAGPMILSLGVLQLNTFLDGLIASYPVTFGTSTILGVAYPLDGSAMAVLSFAQRLYQFPLGVFGIAIATAIFPQLARQADDEQAFLATLRRGLRLVIFIGLPASIGLMLVRNELTATIYQGGEFTLEEGRRVAAVLLGYAPAIWAYSMTHTLTRAYYARGDSRTPVRIALAVVALNLALNLVLIWFLREAGLAWSTAISACVQVVALAALFRRHLPKIIDQSVLEGWRKTMLATVVMIVAVGGVSLLFPDERPWALQLGALGALVAVGAASVAAVAMWLRMPELRWALGLAREKE